MVSHDSQQEIRTRLQSDRGRLQGEIDGLRRGVDSETFQEDEGTDTVSMHPADGASELFEREKNLSVLNTLQSSLDDVDKAMAKLDAGTYGVCDNCGRPIAEKRLEAMPSAIYCIDCQSVLEKTGRLPVR
jgi:DnaK suppressor protein